MGRDFDVFVMGGGSGGVRCARIAAGHGARVGIAEERFWGGTCVNVGCVPKKLMVMASEYGAAIRDSRGFGWDVTDGTHNWAALIAAKDREIARLNAIYVRLLESATTFESRATLLDAHTLDVGGRIVTADNIVIAVGGRPVPLDCPGGELAIVSDAAFFLEQAPRRVVMIGGGYISVEFACIFRGLGAEVDLVMRQALPLRGFDEEIRVELAESLTSQGIRLHTSASIARVERVGDARRVVLRDGAALDADLVFAALGRLPFTDTLGLERAGVEVDGFGAVRVDREGRTSQSNIFAIGDVTNRINLTPVAIAEGHALADMLYGPDQRSWHLDRVASAVFSSPPIASVGLTEAAAAARGPADIYCTKFTPMRHVLSGRVRKTFMKLVVDAQSQRVLGAHMIGEDAPEIMQGISIALNGGSDEIRFRPNGRNSSDRRRRVRNAEDPDASRRRATQRTGGGPACSARGNRRGRDGRGRLARHSGGTAARAWRAALSSPAGSALTRTF